MSRKEDAYLQKIQADIDECLALLETLRGRYEQYFLGMERLPPDQQRKDIFRRIHHLEHLTINNTSTKFRIQTLSQKFRTYGEYWNRILRQIEDGTYSRHVARARKIKAAAAPPPAAALEAQSPPTPAPNRSFLDEIGDLADDVLASLGDSFQPRPVKPPAEPPKPPSPAASPPAAAPQAPPAAVAAVARPLPVFQKPAPPPSGADAEAKQLYDQLAKARAQHSPGGALPGFDDFRKSLDRQTQQLQQANPGRKVKFRVIVQNGRPLIQPLIES